VILYSSQLAAFVGRNPHTNVSKVFNKLYEKYFMAKIRECKMEKLIEERNVGDSGKIKKMSEKIGDVNLLRKMEDMSKRNMSTLSLQKERNELLVEIGNVLDEEEKMDIKKAMESFTNKSFGTDKEDNVVEVYKKKYGCEVITKIEMRRKKIVDIGGDELWLVSKLDGMKMDGTIVEIKNRMYKLFGMVKEYEGVQVHAYMNVYGLDKAELVEYLKVGKGTMLVHEMERDVKYWEKFEGDMRRYFGVFLKIGKSKSLLKKYLGLDEKSQDEFIAKHCYIIFYNNLYGI